MLFWSNPLTTYSPTRETPGGSLLLDLGPPGRAGNSVLAHWTPLLPMIDLDSSSSLEDQLESAMSQAYEEADAAKASERTEAKRAWDRAAEVFGRLAVRARKNEDQSK